MSEISSDNNVTKPETKSNKLKLSPPWVNFYREIQELFRWDDDVKVIYNEDDASIKLLVGDADKAAALEELLPKERRFGNVTVNLTVVPPNNKTNSRVANLFKEAFKNNGALSYMSTIEGIFTNPITYVVFQNEVVQYYNDDIGDVNGMRSTLYQEIAKDVFGEKEGIFFCTQYMDHEGNEYIDSKTVEDIWS